MILNVCYEYGITNDLIYNPLKSVCMVFKPRRFKLYCPTVAIGDECLKYVDTFKYLGFVFSENKKDDADMLRQFRSLYAKANKITRMFHYYTADVKLLLISLNLIVLLFIVDICGLITKHQHSAN